ncbi:MAG: zinc ABC transporter substrate-binding protein [Candidatus Eisenbacteria bacterium]|nr:zinc ABC transporter substrate-binding protein [Candidatus Eisenbacteria bacterium]
MRTFRIGTLAISMMLLLITGAEAKLRVVATLTEIGALAEEIGGDRVEVARLAKGNEDPHTLPAKPSHSRRMMEADLLVYNGLQLEVGWLPLLIEGARNPRIRPGTVGHLDLSSFIEPLEVPTGSVDRSMGDVHPEGNPHYTVDPSVYPALAKGLAERLSAIDPEGGPHYAARLADFERRWSEKLAEWRSRLAFLQGEPIVTYHKQWEYFARTFGLRVIDNVESKPGIPPTPRHITDLEARIRAENVRRLVHSDLIDPAIMKKLASRSGSLAIALPQAVDSRDGTGDLFSWFETLVSVLESAREED